ncbi:uncharacterized protein RJT21DRAFT_115860 [Scheffersomyces amazonensis]|uniref:uncharacterized protein n=1 Tax=Scheffersomyces amazonensis TaxID=1078765 RepID=UPI00315D55A0
MATNKERKEVLELVEDNFRADLAIHLYSIVLLKCINPYYPNSRWSHWPLPADEVPIPKGEFTYCDNVVDESSFGTTIDEDEATQQEEKKRVREECIRQRKVNKTSNKESGTGNDREESANKVEEYVIENDVDHQVERQIEEEEEEDEDLSTNYFANYGSNDEEEFSDSDDEIDFSMPISKVTYIEKEVDAKAELVNELNAMIARKIHQRIQDMKSRRVLGTDLEIRDDIQQSDLVKRLSVQLANKVNTMVDRLNDKIDKKSELILDWHNVLMEGIELVDLPHNSSDILRHQEIYEHCEDLFNNIDYRYELDDEEDDGIDNEDLTTSSGALVVTKYLEKIKESYDNVRHPLFQIFPHRYLIHLREKVAFNDKFRRLYFNKLHTMAKYQQIEWSKRQRPSKIKGITPLKKDLSNIKQVQQEALVHYSHNIDEEEYILRKYA